MNKDYNIDSIKSISGIEHIRCRSGMWIGSVGEAGILHLLTEVIDNSVDEFNEGRGNKIDIYIDQSRSNDIISVRDYGNGIPSGIAEDGENTLTKVFTSLFTGGKFEDAYSSDVSGMNGVGVKAVNALSSILKVESYYNGVRYHQEFRKGKAYTEVTEHGTAKESGTKITFIPDSEIFKDARLSIEDVILKGKYLASIKPNLEINITIKDQNGEVKKHLFKEENELDLILKEGRTEETTLMDFSYFSDNVRIKLEYQPTSSSSMKSFCNTVYTRDGGYHEDSVISVLINCIKKLTGKNISKSLVLQGLNCVISVYKKNPIYRGQNKTRIADEDIKKFVYEELYQPIYDALSKKKKFLKYITDISQAQEKAIEESALKAVSSDIKSRTKDNQLPEKLIYVQNCKPEKRELILCEGSSAGGSISKARLTEFQEVLPIKGKCLNLVKSGMTKALDNAEVRDIFLAVGGMEETNTKLRTHNVLIQCFTGDTKVKLLEGYSLSFEELARKEKENPDSEFWVYALDKEGNPVPALGYHPQITDYSKKIYHIILDDDSEIKCTEDHRIMLRDMTYKRADELKIGDSLMSLKTKYCDNTSHNFDREMIYNPAKAEWEFTHKIVFREINKYSPSDGYSIHHVDHDFLNNHPDNLSEMKTKNHRRLHGIQVLVKYNKSQKHRDTIRRLHKKRDCLYYKCGKIDVKNGLYENKSILSLYRENHAVPDFRLTNQNREYQVSVNRGKIRKILAFLMHKNLPINRINYDLLRRGNAVKFQNIELFFTTLNEAISLAEKDLKNRKYNFSDLEEYYYSQKKFIDHSRLKIGKYVRNLIFSGKKFNQYNYNKYRDKLPTYQSLLNYFENYESVIEYARNYNHQIKNIWIEELEEEIPVYCMEVLEHHNFMLDSGNVIVHNCDADADGCLLGETKILLTNGKKVEIKDLVEEKEFEVYSTDEKGRVVFGRGHDARVTKKVDRIYKIKLGYSKGSTICCTDNHPFLMKDLSYKRADELRVYDRLFPLYQDTLNTITEIEVEELEKAVKVYDLTVDNYHNFALSQGIFVHNSHIVSLIESMFLMAFPSFIRDHNLYVIKTALFCATDGKRRTYGQTAKQAGARFKKEFKSDKFYIQRNKGIGEMSPVDLRYFIDPKTRTVEKIVLGENSKEEIKKLMGDDSTYRRTLMQEIDEDIFENNMNNDSL